MENYKPIFRICADIVAIILLAWAPIWAVAIISIAFAFLFAPYYELLLWGLVFDSLYGFHSLYGIISALVIFVIIEVLKKRTRV